MFFVATREVVLVVHTAQCTLHGLLFGVMDDHAIKTCIETFNHCAPHRKHCIIRSFKYYVKLIDWIMDFPGNSGIGKAFPGTLIALKWYEITGFRVKNPGIDGICILSLPMHFKRIVSSRKVTSLRDLYTANRYRVPINSNQIWDS